MIKVIFFGTSEFSSEILKALDKESDFDVLACITQPGKPVGRKKEIQESPVSSTAKELGIETLKPESVKNNESMLNKIKGYEADIFVVIAYGQIIPQEILDAAKLGALNIHPSLLPKYRGPSPIHAALLNGDKETGVTIMLMDALMDHGPILQQKTRAVEPNETYPDLEAKLLDISKTMIVESARLFAQGKINPMTQNHSSATFTKIISKEDGRVDWNKRVSEIYNKYRAYIIWPGIFTNWEGKKLKILECIPSRESSTFAPGTVFLKNEKVYVQCGAESLMIQKVQLEGKKPTQIMDFLRGYKNFIGSKLN